jgi:hypothetical protein
MPTPAAAAVAAPEAPGFPPPRCVRARTCQPGERAQRQRRVRGNRASLSAGSDPRRRGPGTRPVRPLGRHAVELDVPFVPHSALPGRCAAGGSAPARDPRAASRWAPRAASATYPGRKVFVFRFLVESAELQNKVVLGAAALIAQSLAAVSIVFPEALVQTLLRKHTEVPVVASCAHTVTSRTLWRKIAAVPRLGGSSPRTIRGGNSLPASISSTSSAGSWSTPPRSPMHLCGDFDRCANFTCPLHTQTCHGLVTRGGGASAASVILAPSRASGKATASSENKTESCAHENDLIQPVVAPPEAARAGEKLLQPPPLRGPIPAPQVGFAL